MHARVCVCGTGSTAYQVSHDSNHPSYSIARLAAGAPIALPPCCCCACECKHSNTTAPDHRPILGGQTKTTQRKSSTTGHAPSTQGTPHSYTPIPGCRGTAPCARPQRPCKPCKPPAHRMHAPWRPAPRIQQPQRAALRRHHHRPRRPRCSEHGALGANPKRPSPFGVKAVG